MSGEERNPKRQRLNTSENSESMEGEERPQQTPSNANTAEQTQEETSSILTNLLGFLNTTFGINSTQATSSEQTTTTSTTPSSEVTEEQSANDNNETKKTLTLKSTPKSPIEDSKKLAELIDSGYQKTSEYLHDHPELIPSFMEFLMGYLQKNEKKVFVDLLFFYHVIKFMTDC
jgi:hypothetical protein